MSVARLFGDPTINLIPVAPLASAAGTMIGVGGASLSLPPGFAHLAGKSCVLGLRAETIPVEDNNSTESFPVEVVAVTPLNEKTSSFSVLTMVAKFWPPKLEPKRRRAGMARRSRGLIPAQRSCSKARAAAGSSAGGVTSHVRSRPLARPCRQSLRELSEAAGPCGEDFLHGHQQGGKSSHCWARPGAGRPQPCA